MVNVTPFTGAMAWDSRVAEERMTLLTGAGNSDELTIPNGATSCIITVFQDANFDAAQPTDAVLISTGTAATSGIVLTPRNNRLELRLGTSPTINAVNANAGAKLIHVTYFFG